MSDTLAALRGVTKKYRDFTLGPVGLEIPAGAIVGLIGENGAGKTTLLRLLCGVAVPDEGDVSLLGSSPADPQARARLGVVFEDSYFYHHLTATQIGKSLAGIFGASWDGALYEALLRRFSLPEGRSKKLLKDYSRGMRMKLSLAGALAHHPSLLLLDEPTAGLDPVVRSEILDLFMEFMQDETHAILLSSHITDDLAQIADAVAYLHRGSLLFCENKDDLLASYGMLRCSQAEVESLPAACRIHTRRTAFGCETLVRNLDIVRDLLPQAVCDPATLDDIMRGYSAADKKNF